MDNVILNANSLSSSIPLTVEGPGKDPKNPTENNKATIKKMVIADPGVGIEVEFTDWPSDTRDVQFVISLYKNEPEGDTVADYKVRANLSVGPKEGVKLDLSSSSAYIFVLPFVDENLEGELYYKVELKATFNDDNGPQTDTSAVYSMDVSRDKKFSYSGNSNVGPTAKDGIEYSNILFHKEGLFWTETYKSNIKNENYCQILHCNKDDTSDGHGASTYSVTYLDVSKLKESVCFYPYVRLKVPVLKPNEFELKEADHDTNESILDLRGKPYFSGEVTISLEAVKPKLPCESSSTL